MAIRRIRKEGDPVLRTVCKPVTQFDESLWRLLDDMQETLKDAGGVGLAAPQVGIPKRLFIMDLGLPQMIEAINPQILKVSGKRVAFPVRILGAMLTARNAAGCGHRTARANGMKWHSQTWGHSVPATKMTT